MNGTAPAGRIPGPQRLDELLDVLVGLASLDFPRRARQDGSGDTFDAFAVGLNMLGEELQSGVVSREALERSNADLRRSEARLSHLIDTLPVVAYTCDPRPPCPATYVSPNVTAVLGHAPADFLGDAAFWLAQVHPDDRERATTGLRTLFRTGRFRHEYRFRHRDGHYVWMRDDRRLLRDGQGRAVELTGAWTEIQFEKESENALRRAAVEAEEASRAKTVFLATISHELRTPLTAVLGFSDALQNGERGVLNAAQQEYVDEIVRAGDHLLALVGDILDYSRLEAGRMEIEREPVELRTLLRDAASMLRPVASARGIVVDTGPREPEVSLPADRRRLTQVVLNLLGNAIKFSLPGAEVRLRVIDTGDGVHVVVEDDGPGIAPEWQARLFRPFVQVSDGPSRSHGGVGLGLAIARRLAELHGGALTLQSEPGRGSRFTVSMPREPHVHAPGLPPSPREGGQ